MGLYVTGMNSKTKQKLTCLMKAICEYKRSHLATWRNSATGPKSATTHRRCCSIKALKSTMDISLHHY